MSSKDSAIELLEEIHRILVLRNENPFRVRAYERAIEAIREHEDLDERAREDRLTEIPGVGKGISAILQEYLLTGKSSTRDELLAALPKGMLELTRIPGLGPKKAEALIEKLGIHSVAELEYACVENQVRDLPGFGQKTQDKLLAGIRFLKTNSGKLRLVDALPLASEIRSALKALPGAEEVLEVGALRRRVEVISEIEFLIRGASQEDVSACVDQLRERNGLRVEIQAHVAPGHLFCHELARLTATPEHWAALGAPAPAHSRSEEDFYGRLGLPWIDPEFRETGEEVALARKGLLGRVLPIGGVKGAFHNHSVYSDGSSTIEELVVAAKKLGLRYIGISDHSESAFYARGLKKDDLIRQRKEISEVQARHPEVRIFWGIESDILADGSLDYEQEILAQFDFVVASVHSRFITDTDPRLQSEKMTRRIIRAIENPATRFLGHLTGRLLLGRPGYELDVPAVIEAAAKNDVAIEINASPARLDIDWRWGPELRKRKTLVAINPDAHDTAELSNIALGEIVARKALLPMESVVSAWPVDKVEAWLRRGR